VNFIYRKWKKFKRYFKHIAIAVDQLFNTVLCGWPDETFSSRCYRLENAVYSGKGDLKDIRKSAFWSLLRMAVDRIFRIVGQKEHCKGAFEYEREHFDSPPSLRKSTEE